MNRLSALLVLAVSASPLLALDAEVAKDAKGRVVYQEERPDPSRGWTIVAKRAYWSLCYESLDRLEEARALIGKQQGEEFANVLEKCGAWLEIAGSAAQLDDGSQVLRLGEYFAIVANDIRDGNVQLSETDFNKLITQAEILVAKSHIIRSNNAFRPVKVKFGGEKLSTKRTPDVIKAEKEIRQQLVQDNFIANLYDVNQSLRHREVAKNYLAVAAQAGDFEIPQCFNNELGKLTGEEDLSIQGNARIEVKENNAAALKFIQDVLPRFEVEQVKAE